MSFDPTPPDSAPKRRHGMKVALIGAGVIAGAITATAFGANAATTHSSGTNAPSGSSSSSTTAPRPHGPGDGRPMGPRDGRPMGPGGAAPVRSDEKSVSAAQQATLRAAALKAVPGGTVIRIETDAGDGAYEAHMKKSDGTLVTVKFDKNLTETAVESGMGKGDPAPPRH